MSRRIGAGKSNGSLWVGKIPTSGLSTIIDLEMSTLLCNRYATCAACASSHADQCVTTSHASLNSFTCKVGMTQLTRSRREESSLSQTIFLQSALDKDSEIMNRLFLLFLYAITSIHAAPAQNSFKGRFIPACFSSRPHCIRPRAEECRDAVFLMGAADPGYPVVFGRANVVEHFSRPFIVPRRWSSVPNNCVVKIDVVNPATTDEFLLHRLVLPAEIIIEACILAGTQCGGSMLVGPRREVELTLGYYGAVTMGPSMLGLPSNTTALLQSPTIDQLIDDRNLTALSIY